MIISITNWVTIHLSNLDLSHQYKYGHTVIKFINSTAIIIHMCNTFITNNSNSNSNSNSNRNSNRNSNSNSNSNIEDSRHCADEHEMRKQLILNIA